MIEKLNPIPLGRAEDLTNQKFGHLTALYRVANRTNRPTWQCQCDCGNYYTAISKELKKGSIRSCGCSKNENHIKNQVGERYGKLVVLRLSQERTQDNKILWECQCDCGNTALIRTGNLKTSQSCGKCFRGEDISRQRFGKLTAIRYDHTDQHKKSIWKCECDCGGVSYVPISELKSGKVQSCGCVGSRGEAVISQLLCEAGIKFEKQKTFPTCRFEKSGYLGIFDFYVDNKYLIEFDGVQHFKPIGGWYDEKSIKDIQTRDNFKNQWCEQNNIPLIRIPYTHLNKISIDDLKLETSHFIITQ